MYAANLRQVYKKNHKDQYFDSWVLFLSHDADTKNEKQIRKRHKKIDEKLRDQNVNYTEITTDDGKRLVYKKFNSEKRKHPLYLIFNKHPLEYTKGDPLMVIEWGKWTDTEDLKTDLMSLVNFFSNEDHRKYVISAKNPKMWKNVVKFLKEHGTSILSIGVSIVLAL